MVGERGREWGGRESPYCQSKLFPLVLKVKEPMHTWLSHLFLHGWDEWCGFPLGSGVNLSRQGDGFPPGCFFFLGGGGGRVDWLGGHSCY